VVPNLAGTDWRDGLVYKLRKYDDTTPEAVQREEKIYDLMRCLGERPFCFFFSHRPIIVEWRNAATM